MGWLVSITQKKTDMAFIDGENGENFMTVLGYPQLGNNRERIVHNILSEYAKDNGLVEYNYPDGFYCFGNPDSQEMADKKHEEWLIKNQIEL